jgi:ATP-dependent Lhr-like helicase
MTAAFTAPPQFTVLAGRVEIGRTDPLLLTEKIDGPGLLLLGADPPVALTQRARRVLAEVRDQHLPTAHPGGTVITRTDDDVRWWTWAGYRANSTLAARLADLAGAGAVLSEPRRFMVGARQARGG